MDHIEITVDGVTNLLSNLKSNKAGGPDKITARFLKEMASFLAYTCIYQSTRLASHCRAFRLVSIDKNQLVRNL